ncbi:MAG: hypothetical protein NUV98_02500 [Candidatus Roizmanbacteria bacterium]|nr:hypothetical protein [Candidatus Roizmanbacteria bacterium]
MENQEKQPGTHVVQSVRQPIAVPGAPVDQTQPIAKKTEKNIQKPDTKKRKIDWLLVLFGSLTLLALTIIGFVEWQRQQYIALQSKRETLVVSFPGETSVTQEQVEVLSSGFLDDKEIVTFIETVEQASTSFDEFEISFVSDVPEGKKAPLYLPVTFTMTGSFDEITRFLSSLLTSEYVIKVDGLELTSKDGFDSSATLLLTARVYVSNEYGK